MPLAARCVPVVSSWVHQFVLTCDDLLAVQFKNGVCCLYPSSNRNLFDIAIASASPGKFVHRYLYKILPYRLIVPPCPASDCGGGGGVQTRCCPGGVPTSLFATITGAGVVDGTYPMTYDAALDKWRAAFDFTPCSVLEVWCQSPSNTWYSLIGGFASSASCSPLALTWAGVDFRLCGGNAGGTLTVTS